MSNPEYIVFTDSELEQARRSYFEKKRLGTECAEPLSKELFCGLVRNTMTNMISIARAAEDSRYPSKHEVDAMAKRLMEYYPMLKETCGEWEHVAKELMKRLSDVKSPRKGKKKCGLDDTFCFFVKSSANNGTQLLHCLSWNLCIPFNTGSADFFDSQKTQVRHYKTLQEIYKTKKPNKSAVTQLLNLEFESRRQFINSDAIKEQDRQSLMRIIQPSNSKYISEMKDRWEIFYSKVQFYGVMKKVMKPPKTLDGVEHAAAVFRALPMLFPSSTVPPKKLGICSEAFFHVLKVRLQYSMYPEGYLRQRPLACPVLLVSEGNCMIAVGTTPVSTFDRKDLNEGLLYLMAYYYALHLTYPKCISTLLSVLQTEMLKDSIHDRDSTPSYRKALGEWKSFIE
ncbi:hypothetical protein ACER0C_001349 [Sarotherodon galilaeus]